jgi:hypothetical protein
MDIYKTRLFERWTKTEGLSNAVICQAVEEMKNGLCDADLGGGLLKKRIARQGQGKRKGFRTLVATNKNNRWFFVFGFPKNQRDNIDKDEEKVLKKLADELLAFTPQILKALENNNELIKVDCDEKDKISNTGSGS